jgi:hypothetical protein
VKPGDARYDAVEPPQGGDELGGLDISGLSLQEAEKKRAMIAERVHEQKSGYAAEARGWSKINFNKDYKIVSYKHIYQLMDVEAVDLGKFKAGAKNNA